jgi:hypothetical protein
VTHSRDLAWVELQNARDLGGLPAAHGVTEYGRIYRSENPDGVSAAGWELIVKSGVRSIVDLRNDAEVSAHTSRPEVLQVHRHPIENWDDTDFMREWGKRLNSPAYYPEIISRWPGAVAAAFSTIADAPEGAVLIHCHGGRDRTGMIVAMLLQLVGVERDAILDDYELGLRIRNSWLESNDARERPLTAAKLDDSVSSARSELQTFLDGTDVRALLLDNGVSEEQLTRISERLLSQ